MKNAFLFWGVGCGGYLLWPWLIRMERTEGKPYLSAHFLTGGNFLAGAGRVEQNRI